MPFDAPASHRLAPRMDAMAPSPFLAVLRAAREVEAMGKTVLYLSMGEPDFETPDAVKAEGVRAIERGDTRYTAMDGTPALKAAIKTKLARDNDLRYGPDEISVTLGGTQAIFNAMLATVAAGDEVILPAPYFPPYISAIQMAGGTPVIVKTREADGFVPTAADIAQAITPRTRWLFLNSPSNPSGAVIEDAQLAAIAEVLRQHPEVLILSDDIYEAILFDRPRFRNIVNLAPDLKDRTLILNGVSKAYAMTGWRVAYVAGPRPIVEGVSQISAVSTFTPSSISQAAAIEALAGPQDLVATRREVYRRRRDRLAPVIAQIPGLTLASPKGAFYLFPSCHRLFGRQTPDGQTISSDLDFALYLLRSQGLAVVHGSAFGMPGYFRVSFAAADEILVEAMNRLGVACAELR